ncbi:hypothetical protein SAMN02745146_0994 [Hymenobacter daecheongensis DSM 21074]|uniref:Uncharacterized protein n=1 Tax=Hymenobacter daecheongensis DSM 21074 TaxID=1121955 RepID=A0A1M6C1C0_9BACT|nr:hypothetical protein [Hymenobacter daecheongensis]SHI54790.1 hypothetical protein SAMN02745146_0994 [Hymenobacter daecheongensis DSM 21074]
MTKLLLAALLTLNLIPAPAQRRRAAPAAHVVSTTVAQGQTLTISGPCAVLYAPNAAKIDHLKQRYGEANFYTSADDNQTYMAKSRAYLQAKGIRVIETTATQLRFAAAGTTTTLDLSSPAYSWGLLLFNGREAPQEANLADPANDVQAIMKK